MNKIQQIRDRAAAIIVLANVRYNIKLPHIDIRFDLTGRSAGTASRNNGQYIVRFNMHMVEHHFEEVLKNTVPHELAHIVCMYTNMGKNHDKVWKSICIYLGGDGQRCHSMTTVPARNTKKFRYVASCGTSLELSTILHNRVQSGKIYRLKATRGTVTKECFVG